MSLSETPPVKIAFDTAQNVSDEILGGAISLCREVGYKQNIMILTFLWSGILLSIRSILKEHGLVQDVRGCYTHSLREIFPELLGTKSKIDKVDELCHHYWINLRKDFTALDTESEISSFIQITNKLNSPDDISATYLLKADPEKCFSQISSNVRANVDCILRQIDNEFRISYRGFVRESHYVKLLSSYNETRSTSSAIQTTSHTRTSMQKQKKKTSSPIKAILIGLAILVGFVAIANFYSDSDPELTPVSEPISGTILSGNEVYDGSEITVHAASDDSCVVKLKTRYGADRISFYVRAGDTVTVGVPDEYLSVYFAFGDTWYGKDNLFGKRTHCQKTEDVRDFTEYTWEFTLYPVNDGNLELTTIGMDEF